MRKALKAAVPVLTLASWFAIPANAGPSNVVRVPEEFPTIQSAVDVAKPGQVVLVHGGPYYEVVTVEKPNLTVRGSSDGAQLFGTFNIFATGVTVEGFQITTRENNQGIQTGPRYHPNSDSGQSGVSNVTIQNNVITAEPENEGAWRAIWLAWCRNCSIRNNKLLSHRGEGISLYGDVTGTVVEYNVLDDNDDFGILLWSNSFKATVSNNSAHRNGSCDIVNFGTRNVFKDNQADCTDGF